MHGPSEVNSWCMKPLRGDFQLDGYRKSCTIRGCTIRTRAVATKAEAYFAYDCAKMYACPISARDIVYAHGLIRPPEYARYYTGADALAARYATKYKPKYIERHERPCWSTLNIIPCRRWCPVIRQAIRLIRQAPHHFTAAAAPSSRLRFCWLVFRFFASSCSDFCTRYFS